MLTVYYQKKQKKNKEKVAKRACKMYVPKSF